MFVASPVDREYFNARRTPASILRCGSCGSLFQEPWPTDEELRGLYGSDYQNYTSSAVPLLSRAAAAYLRRSGARFVRRYGRDASVLDFGCGQGGFLRALAQAGCSRLAGFDFVLYDDLASLSGVRFFDSIDAIRASGARFHVIRMQHVIEHLTDLDGRMTILSDLLEDDGQIIGQTPNAAHYTARLMGQYWGPLHFPYHTMLFSPAGLDRAAARWRLQLRETAGAILPTGWALSGENMLKHACGSRTRGRTALYTVLVALSMPMALLDRVLSHEATANFDFVLTKR